jgi:hypothetical protein
MLCYVRSTTSRRQALMVGFVATCLYTTRDDAKAQKHPQQATSRTAASQLQTKLQQPQAHAIKPTSVDTHLRTLTQMLTTTTAAFTTTNSSHVQKSNKHSLCAVLPLLFQDFLTPAEVCSIRVCNGLHGFCT